MFIVFRKLWILFGAVWITLLPLGARKHKNVVPDSLQRLDFNIHGIHFKMQRVEGGGFMMGATPEQIDNDIYTNKPAHFVLLAPYYIATTEVTNALWRAVMPEHDAIIPRGYPYNPISYISWYDCQEFVRRLDSITGLPFRLPTEAEWEYAARGGAKSKSYRFAGSDIADSVGWTYPCSGNWTHAVAKKRPNELGLYDMTGNVSEWCQDRYGTYNLSTKPNPCGPDTGSFRIVRGSSYDECIANSHLSMRRWYLPETSVGYVGLRVALTLPDEPMMQVIPEEPPLIRSVRLKGKKIRFLYVPAEKPYYISEEVEWLLWYKIMQTEPPQKIRNIAVGMSHTDRVHFAETCSQIAKEVMLVASAEQIVTAERNDLIEPFQPDKKQRRPKTIRQIQRKRKRIDRVTKWTALASSRLTKRLIRNKPDDPVLQMYEVEDKNRPLRLVIEAK